MVRGEDEEGSARRERYAGLAARWVARAWGQGPPRLMGAGDGAVSAVERALRQRRRHTELMRVVRRGAVGGALALAAAGFVLVLRGERPEQALNGTASRGAVHAGASQTASPTARGPSPTSALPDPRALVVMAEPSRSWTLATGTRVAAPPGAPLRIASAEGTVLTLDPDSILTVVDLGAVRRFGLLRGAVHAQVAKLARGERFIIDTADAEVEVRGTAFRVETGVAAPACPRRSPGRLHAAGPAVAQPITSRVLVESGIVSVTAGGDEARLRPGESWPAPCPGAPGPVRTATSSARAPLARAAADSSLRAQNELFSAAVAARNAGQTNRAIALFEQLVREHPQSSLLESAMAARMRLLAGVEPARAAEAAASYLSRFPDGVARTEAATLMHGSGVP